MSPKSPLVSLGLCAVSSLTFEDEIAGRGAKPAGTTEVAAGAGKKTLRMKSNGTAVVEDVVCTVFFKGDS